MLFPSQLVEKLLEVFWRINFLSCVEIEEMLQSEVDSKRVLFRDVLAELRAFLVRMDNEGDEILSTGVFGNRGRADLPVFNSSRNDNWNSIITLFSFNEFWNLNFLRFKVYS